MQCGTITTLISPGDCTLQCGIWLWNHDSEFTKWQHPAMWHVAHDIEFARWQQPVMWQVALGWHAIKFAQTSAILEFYIWFRFRPYHRSRHVILHQSAKFYPNRTTLSRNRWSTWVELCRYKRAFTDFAAFLCGLTYVNFEAIKFN